MSNIPNCIEKHVVPAQVIRQRLSDYAVGKFSTITSKKGTKKAIKKELILVNESKGYSSDYINGGEVILLLSDSKALAKPIVQIALKVLHEDDHLALVFKPAGILTSGNKKLTLENCLPFNLKKSPESDALLRAEPIHRLDYPTSGIVMVGKTASCTIALNQQFKDKSILKTYLAVAIGSMPQSGKIKDSIEGKESITGYRIIDKVNSKKYGQLNLLEVKPQTGRRHQIRIHLSTHGFPILGDIKYGIEGKLSFGNGLYLHASKVTFIHPKSKEEHRIESEIPKKFKRLFPDVFQFKKK